jgi:HEAT repeat protein
MADHASIVVPALISALRDSDPTVVQGALESLGEIGPSASRAVPMILPLLESPDPEIRAASAFAIGFLGDAPKGLIPSLQRLLDDKVPTVREWAADALGRLGTKAVAAKDALRPILCDPDPNVRLSAAAAYWKLGGDPEISVSTLRLELRSEDESVRIHALILLWEELGPVARAVAPALETALKREDPYLRWIAAGAYWAVTKDAKLAVPALVSVLSCKNRSDQTSALAVLEEIGPPAKDAVPHIRPLLKHDRQDVRVAAWHALQSIASDSKAKPVSDGTK